MPDVTELTEIASGLQFPEGPVAMSDGSIVLTEIVAARSRASTADGTSRSWPRPAAGPNGAAIGPDGKLYVCNNGGFD